ncbi:hypothetical protein ACI2OX_04265 [Bacillus sp. N9]
MKQYDNYNKYILAERAKQWQLSLKRYTDAQAQVKDLHNQIGELEEQIIHLEEEQKAMSQKELAENEGSAFARMKFGSLKVN